MENTKKESRDRRGNRGEEVKERKGYKRQGH
jgi:hypothetical protein